MNNRTQVLKSKIEKLDSLAEATIMLMEVTLAEGVNTLEMFTEVQAMDATLEKIEESIEQLEDELENIHSKKTLEQENEDLIALLEEQQDEIDDWYDYARELEGNLEELRKFTAIGNRLEDELERIEETELSILKTRKKLCFIQFKEMLKRNPNIKNYVAAEELGVTLETIVKLRCMLQG